jgi:hypothetical protein
MRAAAALASLSLLLAGARAAAAQPGQTAPAPARLGLLGDEEREILARGEIGTGEHVAGGLVGTVVGFGLGHAIQGRFLERGWIFAAGEGVAAGMILTYAVQCANTSGEERCEDHRGWFAGGMILAIAFRGWQIVDAWYGPAVHNGRVRQIRWRAGLPPVGFHLAPAAAGAGGTAGLTLRF